MDLIVGDNVETILERLTQATAWCGPRVNLRDPKNCLRTANLNPHPLEDGRKAVVAYVARERYTALGRPAKESTFDLAGGRLLIYQPDLNLAHGLEEEATKGYVDVNNIPPWDTWIAYVYESKGDYMNYLLSWVPGPFVSLVNEGIKVSPEICFNWLDATDFELRRLLEHCR